MARKTTQGTPPEDKPINRAETQPPPHSPRTEEDIRQEEGNDTVPATGRPAHDPQAAPREGRPEVVRAEQEARHGTDKGPVDTEPRPATANTMGVVGGGDAERDKRDVRAGPGDAGAQHSPQIRTVGSGKRPRPKPGSIFIWIAVGVLVLIALMYLRAA